MADEILIADLNDPPADSSWRDQVAMHPYAPQLVYAQGIKEALDAFERHQIAAIVIHSDNPGPETDQLLELFQGRVGCLPEFIGVVCSDPSPSVMIRVYEYSVEQFFPKEGWTEHLKSFMSNVSSSLSDPSSTERKTVDLAKSIRSADQQKIAEAEANLAEDAKHDFRAAYAQGRALEATGKYQDAIDVFAKSQEMNTLFRPGQTSLGEACLITGQVDRAIAIFEKLEKANPKNVSRKSSLVAAYCEKGDFAKAKEILDQTKSLGADSSAALQAEALFYLSQGKIKEAVEILDRLQEVGPFFATKLNELGIKLSQNNNFKGALILYQKAHRIVRSELKYKVSLNASLACRRAGELDKALKYIQRAQLEYGGANEKLDKIEANLKALIKKAG